MKPLVLYCKSYRTDLRRVVRLAQSIRQFNTENIPFYVSVPQSDFSLFREHLAEFNTSLLTDEEILGASPRIQAGQIEKMPGSMSQQVVKSEFWRLGHSISYVCLDSDAIFIRPFSTADFVAPDGVPYTVLDEAHELLDDAIRHRHERVLQAFVREAELVQGIFGRKGRRYSFGPFPLVWHRAVWESLDINFLQPKNLSFADAIELAPIESRWYGEALLAYKEIPLLPCQAIFKVYHYAWQLDRDRRNSVNNEILKEIYVGVIYQSAWERELDWPAEGGNMASRLGRRIRRKLGRI